MSKKQILSPGLTTNQHMGKWGLKQWTEATKNLNEKLFDGNPQNLKMFFLRGYP